VAPAECINVVTPRDYPLPNPPPQGGRERAVHAAKIGYRLLPHCLLDEFAGGFRQELVGCFAIN